LRFDPGGIERRLQGTSNVYIGHEGRCSQEENHKVGKGPMDLLQPWISSVGARWFYAGGIFIFILNFFYEKNVVTVFNDDVHQGWCKI
jgi:hypothetical protein